MSKFQSYAVETIANGSCHAMFDVELVVLSVPSVLDRSIVPVSPLFDSRDDQKRYSHRY